MRKEVELCGVLENDQERGLTPLHEGERNHCPRLGIPHDQITNGIIAEQSLSIRRGVLCQLIDSFNLGASAYLHSTALFFKGLVLWELEKEIVKLYLSFYDWILEERSITGIGSA